MSQIFIPSLIVDEIIIHEANMASEPLWVPKREAVHEVATHAVANLLLSFPMNPLTFVDKALMNELQAPPKSNSVSENELWSSIGISGFGKVTLESIASCAKFQGTLEVGLDEEE